MRFLAFPVLISIIGSSNGQQHESQLNIRRRVEEKSSQASRETFSFSSGSTSSFSKINDPKHSAETKIIKSDGITRNAIIHIGPLKTGSTSIQGDIKQLRDDLESDNYKLPAAPGEVNMGGLRDCFVIGHWKDATCSRDQVQMVTDIGNDGKSNIIVTVENLSFPDTNIAEFKKLLQPHWSNPIVVAYYRRYYDWLYSSWNQLVKGDKYEGRQSFVQFMNKMNTPKKRDEQFYSSHYTYGLVTRWKGFFNHVKVYNIHDETHHTNTAKFFCDALPDAYHSCNAVLELEANRGELHYNEAHDLHYEDLAYLAVNRNYIASAQTSAGIDMKTVVKVVQYQQEVVWKLNKYDFVGKECLSEDILDYLLDFSIMAERELFPDFFATDAGEQTLREEFDQDKSTKLCNIDAGIILDTDPKWKEFFQTSYWETYDLMKKDKSP